jgi:hypothetical protein
LAGLEKKCRELTWPHLKKSSRLNYDYFFGKYLVPQLGKGRPDVREGRRGKQGRAL